MKGFILNAALSHLETEYAELPMDSLLDALDAPAGGLYSPICDYADNTLHDLMETASLLLGVSSRKPSKVIGVHIFSELMAVNSYWLEQSENTFELLKNHDNFLNGITKGSFPGFVAPSFSCMEISPDMLEVSYQSTFLLADIAEGMIDAMILYNKESISVEAVKTASPVSCSRQFILRRYERKPRLTD